jgi:hypothetical protein
MAPAPEPGFSTGDPGDARKAVLVAAKVKL